MNKIISIKSSIFFVLIALLVSFQAVNAQKISPKKQIEQIAREAKGIVGVSIIGLDDKTSISVNEKKHFVMQSVYKFPLALAVLKKVEEGKFSLDQKIFVKKEDLRPNTWSPLREEFPEGNIEVSLADLLRYVVSKSDNNVCDLLFRMLGGTNEVEKYIHSLGIKEISIKTTEEEMSKGWEVQYTNWVTPTAMTELLRKFYQGKILSETNTRFLLKTMGETITGQNRLKALLPKDAVVAHRPGTSVTNDKGVSAATNDVGIIKIKNKTLIISVFVNDSTADIKTREEVIAKIAKTIWDSYQSSAK